MQKISTLVNEAACNSSVSSSALCTLSSFRGPRCWGCTCLVALLCELQHMFVHMRHMFPFLGTRDTSSWVEQPSLAC